MVLLSRENTDIGTREYGLLMVCEKDGDKFWLDLQSGKPLSVPFKVVDFLFIPKACDVVYRVNYE